MLKHRETSNKNVFRHYSHIVIQNLGCSAEAVKNRSVHAMLSFRQDCIHQGVAQLLQVASKLMGQNKMKELCCSNDSTSLEHML